MAQVTWSPQAIGELDSICEFIARDSQRYAQIVGQNIIEIVATAAVSPLEGWEVPEYGRPEIRERLYKNYRIVYRVASSGIEIITITHGSRPLPGRLS